MQKEKRLNIAKSLDKNKLEKVWLRYKADHNSHDENILVKNYWAWIIKLSSTTKKYFNIQVDLDDLIAEASIGLVKALRKFDPEQQDKGIDSFVLYAYRRVRGMIVDCQSEWSGIPRSVRRNMAAYRKAQFDLHGKQDESPKRIKEEANLSDKNISCIDSAVKWFTKQSITITPDFDTPILDPHRSPDQALEDKDLVYSLISKLSNEHRDILIKSAVFGEGKIQIAKELGLTESGAHYRYKAALREVHRLFSIDRSGINADIARYAEGFKAEVA
jgi:RNA polymerase sigma factor (sigma-70 family)